MLTLSPNLSTRMPSPGRVLLPLALLSVALCAPVASAVQHYSSCELGGLVDPYPVDVCREFTAATGLIFEIVFSTDDGVGVVVTWGMDDMSWSYGVKVCYRDPYNLWVSASDCEAVPATTDPAGVPTFTRRTLFRVEGTVMQLMSGMTLP